MTKNDSDTSNNSNNKRTRSKSGIQRVPQSVSLDKDIITKLTNTAAHQGLTKSQLVETLVADGLNTKVGGEKPTILACLNFKGGVAKSTTICSTAVCLGDKGRKVLIIDFDPQGNTSQLFGVFDAKEQQPCIFDALFAAGIDEKRKTLDEVMCKTKFPNVSIIPSNFRFLEADSYFRNEKTGADTLLKYALEELSESYDYILIDCGPRLDMTITNVIVALEAGSPYSMIILPVKIDGSTIAGLPKAINTINQVAKTRRTSPCNWRILVTIAEQGTNAHRAGMEELHRLLPGDCFFETIIPKGTKTNESSLAMMPLVAYEPDSPVSLAYRKLTEEIEDMHEQNEEQI